MFHSQEPLIATSNVGDYRNLQSKQMSRKELIATNASGARIEWAVTQKLDSAAKSGEMDRNRRGESDSGRSRQTVGLLSLNLKAHIVASSKMRAQRRST